MLIYFVVGARLAARGIIRRKTYILCGRREACRYPKPAYPLHILCGNGKTIRSNSVLIYFVVGERTAASARRPPPLLEPWGRGKACRYPKPAYPLHILCGSGKACLYAKPAYPSYEPWGRGKACRYPKPAYPSYEP